MTRENFSDRSGIAGGIIENNIIFRAKAELLERDALIFHYQNEIPFLEENKTIIDGEELAIFKLQTLDPKYSTYFVTNPYCANGESQCLMNGMGSHTIPQLALKKSSGGV